jgi:hypothetical protein
MERSMKTLIVIATLMLSVTASAQQTTIRDSMGREIGSVSTDSSGTRTFRDNMGRMTGTATRDGGGTTTFRDSSGRLTGTASPNKTSR